MLNIYLILTFLLIILYIYFSVKNRNKKEDFSLLNGIYSHKYNYDEIYRGILWMYECEVKNISDPFVITHSNENNTITNPTSLRFKTESFEIRSSC